MSFDSLSAEIALEILSLASRTDLQNLSVCSQRFHSLTQPLLYKTFQQTGIEAIPNIIRSIVAKPHLARYIKHVDLTLFAQHEEKIDINISPISLEYRAFVRSQLRGRLASFKGYSTAGIYNRIMSCKDNWEALAALLFIICSANLESITMQCQKYEPTYILSILELAANRKRPYFPKLRRVTLMPHPDFAHQIREPISCFDEILSHTLRIRHLPELHLKHFFYPLHTIFVPDRNSQTESQETFAIKVLSITDSHLDPGYFRVTLTHFDALTHLKYQHVKPAGVSYQLHLIPEMIEEGLFKSRHTLEVLVLEESEADDTLPHGGIYHPLGSMGDFEKLKVIKIQASRILDYTSVCSHRDKTCTYTPKRGTAFTTGLPPSLEHLRLSDCRPSIYGPISQLLLSAKLPPNLKTIKVSFDMPLLLSQYPFGELTSDAILVNCTEDHLGCSQRRGADVAELFIHRLGKGDIAYPGRCNVPVVYVSIEVGVIRKFRDTV
jgi:hypothetical protein